MVLYDYELPASAVTGGLQLAFKDISLAFLCTLH
jgi:hypothetical protein